MLLIITFIIMLISLLINVPVALSILIASAFYFIANDAFTNEALVQQMIGGVESFPLLAIVFFITAGILMNYTGITTRIVRFAQVAIGHMTGSLAKVNVLLSVLMGGLSGSNVADASMQSKILVPEMTKKGYDKGFSTALTASSSIITPIIPPGIALILYGYIGNVSIGDLFLAGIIPGLMLSILLLIYVHFTAKKRGFETEVTERASFKELLIASKDALLAIFLPVIIIGGIRLGIFSPTEAGAIAVLYALFLGFVIYREMNFKDLLNAFKESVHIISTVMIIISAGTVLGWVFTLERLPQTLTNIITASIENPSLFLFAVLIILLVLGMFVEGNVLLIILTPIFIPMLDAYNIDPVHFGIFFIMTMSLGTITPPIGTIMFITSSITKTRIDKFIKEVKPIWGLLILACLIIAYVPVVSMLLPNLLE
ncbi:TRAP transporter large permease [Salinicoccus albus]|uniref:TRAP transporter large permease n=1 Tax=Salinicoccus albus TaxID=418756 RepID=UPI00036D45B9|nr:TRAP transporter large permease [Salinicoccus albus]